MREEKAENIPAKKSTIGQFANDVRAEARKVTWATRGETITSSIFVLVLSIFTALFFFLADGIMHATINFVLELAKKIGG